MTEKSQLRLPPNTWLEAVLAHVSASSARDRELAERRTFADPPATLKEVAATYGLTRERMRQLEDRWIRCCPVVQPESLDTVLLRLRAGRTTPLRLPELARLAPWLAGVDSHRALFAGALRSFDCQHRCFDDPAGAFVSLAVAADRPRVLGRCRARLRDPALRGGDLPAKTAAIAAVLAELGIQELVTPVMAQLQSEGPGVQLASDKAQLERVLAEAGTPLTFRQLLQALAPMTARRLSNVLAEADVVHAGPRTFVLRRSVEDFDALLPRVQVDVLDFLGCEPELQWGTTDLLAAMAEAGAEWATTLPLAAFENLLRQIDGVKNLRRSLWGLAAVHQDRLRVLDVAIETLEAAGGALRHDHLLAAIRRRRSIGKAWRPRYPVVFTADGRLGLGERDLGLAPPMFAAWTAALRERLAAQVPVAEGGLQDLLVAVGGPTLPVKVLRDLIAGEQTLFARFRAQWPAAPGRREDPSR